MLNKKSFQLTISIIVFIWNIALSLGLCIAMTNKIGYTKQGLLSTSLSLRYITIIFIVIFMCLTIIFFILNAKSIKGKIPFTKYCVSLLVIVSLLLLSSGFINVFNICDCAKRLINIVNGNIIVGEKINSFITRNVFLLILYILCTALSIIYFSFLIKRLTSKAKTSTQPNLGTSID